MKKYTHKLINNKGFTLVEILVVLAIIGILAGVITPIVFRKIEDGRDVKAKAMMTDVVLAANTYNSDHSTITGGFLVNEVSGAADAGGYTAATGVYAGGATTVAGNVDKFISMLTNTATATDVINRRDIAYLKMEEANVQRKYKSGLIYNGDVAMGMVDPWGNRFFIGLNYDADKEIESAVMPTGAANLGSSVIAVSCGGRDGLFNDDRDVKSWE